MAESNQVTLNRATIPGGEVAAADTIAAKQYQLIKLILGAAGVNDGPVSAANPLPTGDAAAAAALASILAKLSADPSTAAGVTAAAAAVVAQLVANLAGTQPISAAALPLPADAATQTTVAALLVELEGKADLAETQPVSAAALPLPSGASSEATLALIEAVLSAWTFISGAALVTLSDAPVESLYDNDTIAIATGTVTAQIVPSMELWQEMEFEVDLTATDTITVKQSIDGVTYFATDPIDMSDGALLGAAGVVSADGLFRMPLIGTHASFTKGGAGAGAATIKWRARVVGR